MDKEPYWLVDTVLGQRDPAPMDMTPKEAMDRNEWLEKQFTRWRWMSRNELRIFDETTSHGSIN